MQTKSVVLLVVLGTFAQNAFGRVAKYPNSDSNKQSDCKLKNNEQSNEDNDLKNFVKMVSSIAMEQPESLQGYEENAIPVLLNKVVTMLNTVGTVAKKVGILEDAKENSNPEETENQDDCKKNNEYSNTNEDYYDNNDDNDDDDDDDDDDDTDDENNTDDNNDNEDEDDDNDDYDEDNNDEKDDLTNVDNNFGITALNVLGSLLSSNGNNIDFI